MMKNHIPQSFDELASLSIEELNILYLKYFSKNNTLNRRCILKPLWYAIQEKKFGSIKSANMRIIENLISTNDNVVLDKKTVEVAAGTLFNKKYKKRFYEVKKSNDGYIYNNTCFSTISAVAREITGVSTNGYKFFGLKK